jgi:hypothetical protein
MAEVRHVHELVVGPAWNVSPPLERPSKKDLGSGGSTTSSPSLVVCSRPHGPTCTRR